MSTNEIGCNLFHLICFSTPRTDMISVHCEKDNIGSLHIASECRSEAVSQPRHLQNASHYSPFCSFSLLLLMTRTEYFNVSINIIGFSKLGPKDGFGPISV